MMEVSTQTQILETRDYSGFSFLPDNRPISTSHVASLMKSMNEEYLFTVIVVNDDLAIIDGQHRFEAIKRLGLTLRYVVIPQYGSDQLHRYNSDMINWSNVDFGHFYEEKNEDYKFFMNTLTANSWNYTVTMLVINGDYNRQITNQFRNGLFFISDYKESRSRIAKFKQIFKYFPATTKILASSVCRIMNHPAYDHKHFLHQLEAQRGSCFTKRTEREQYAHLIELYNYRQKTNRL